MSEDPMKELYEAARAEAPSAAARAKAMASLGLSAAPAAAGAAGAAASAGLPVVVKGAIVAVLVASAFGAGVFVGERRAREDVYWRLPAPQVQPPPAPVVVAPPPVEPPPVLPQPVVEPVAPVIKPKPAPKVDDADALALELAALDRARKLLREGSAKESLEAVALYEKQFPTGTLAPEATLVRLEALLAVGKRAEAEALAKRFLATHSSELLQQRVQRLLDGK